MRGDYEVEKSEAYNVGTMILTEIKSSTKQMLGWVGDAVTAIAVS